MVKVVEFSGFVLDAENALLVREGTRIPLSPKDCALLFYLVTNAGRVLSHAELLRAVWGDTSVGPDVLKTRIARIRRLLQDDADSPRFIANVHGEGYRFLPQRDTQSHEVAVEQARASRPPLVGREPALAALDEALGEALDGSRQVVLITGDAGIGKTTLIDAFVERAHDRSDGETGRRTPGVRLWCGRGQCIEHYGSGEPYLPMMEALSRLGRADTTRALKRALERYAPSWLQHLPSLLEPEERDALQRRIGAPTRDGMLRELADALEAFASSIGSEGDSVVVLVIEDLHWADGSTLDFLQMLARRRERARLLVLGSYRDVDVVGRGHPLRTVLQELCAHGAIRELKLEPLTGEDVARYLDVECPRHDFPRELAAVIHHRTAGNPLFLRDITRDLRAQGVIACSEQTWRFQGDLSRVAAMLPSSIHQLVVRQRDNLNPDDQRLLEAASIAGVEFCAAGIAPALTLSPADVEERCVRLAECQTFVRFVGSEEWPDGTRSMRFAFIHALYQELWHARVGDRRREEWHLQIATHKERAYQDRAPTIASELADHFERGRDYCRAAVYREHASRLAVHRGAVAESRRHLERALESLSKMPETADRFTLEVRLRIALGTIRALTEGFGSADAASEFVRAHELCRSTSIGPELLESVFGLCRFFCIRGDLGRARELADHMQAIVADGADPVRMMAAHAGCGSVFVARGEMPDAVDALTAGLELARHHWHDGLVGVYGGDLEVVCASTLGNALQIRGYPDRAFCAMTESLRTARARSSPLAIVDASFGAALFYQFRRDADRVLEMADQSERIVSEFGLSEFRPMANAHRGWALCARGDLQDGLCLLRGAAVMLRDAGALFYRSFVLCWIVDALTTAGELVDARQSLTDAFETAARNGPGVYDAELHRLDGELKLASGQAGAAEEAAIAFTEALATARRQQAKSWELRAALSLGRLWAGNGRRDEAHALVADTYSWFTEGFETPDARAARSFVDALASPD